MEKPRYRWSNERQKWEEVFTIEIHDYFIYIDRCHVSHKLPMYLYDTYNNLTR